MSKTIWALLLIIVCMAGGILYFAVPSVQATTNQKFLAPLSVKVAEGLTTISKHPVWIAWGPLFGLIGGVILTTTCFLVVIPKVKSSRRITQIKKKVQDTYQMDLPYREPDIEPAVKEAKGSSAVEEEAAVEEAV